MSPASGGLRQDVGELENVFVGTDRTVEIDVFDEDGYAVDVSAFAMAWDLFLAAASQVSKATGGSGITVTDGRPSRRAKNTQSGTNNRVQIAIADTDWNALDSSAAYTHELRRTDAGAADVIAYGDWLFVG